LTEQGVFSQAHKIEERVLGQKDEAMQVKKPAFLAI
jgi:hypothetical protein